MEKLIIIKYGELSTKKGNIGFFLYNLKKNIDFSLKSTPHKINYDKGRMFISSDEDNFDLIIKKLSKVFGIHEFFVGYKIPTSNLDEINAFIEELLIKKDFTTFKVNTKRTDKSYPLTSLEISAKVGGYLLNKLKKIIVDVHNPELEINIEIRYQESIIYFDKYKGIGGYPVSSLGKGLLMLSGGIDSPVAGYMAMKRGVKIEAIYFELPPHTSEAAKQKVISLAKTLSDYNSDIKLHIINFTEIQETIYKSIPHEYLITIMRRMMYRISAIVASKSNCKTIINGESIGQVASQTLTSMEVINNAIDKLVIRPLACLDKLEIIKIAETIGTYDTSILPYEDCCTIFVPDHPVINPILKTCLEYEELIDYKQMIYEAIKNMETIKLNNKVDDHEGIL